MSAEDDPNQEMAHLPPAIRVAIKSFGLVSNVVFWDFEKGQPGAFWRLFIRKDMEHKGLIPPRSDSED